MKVMKTLSVAVLTLGLTALPLTVAVADEQKVQAPSPEGTTGPAQVQQPASQPQDTRPPGTAAPQPTGQQTASQQQTEVDVSSLIGSKVRNQDGQETGEIKRLMVDPTQGRITAVVIEMGGGLLSDGKTLSVPWDTVKVTRDGQNLVVVPEQPALESAPKAGQQKREESPAASPRTDQPEQQRQ